MSLAAHARGSSIISLVGAASAGARKSPPILVNDLTRTQFPNQPLLRRRRRVRGPLRHTPGSVRSMWAPATSDQASVRTTRDAEHSNTEMRGGEDFDIPRGTRARRRGERWGAEFLKDSDFCRWIDIPPILVGIAWWRVARSEMLCLTNHALDQFPELFSSSSRGWWHRTASVFAGRRPPARPSAGALPHQPRARPVPRGHPEVRASGSARGRPLAVRGP